MDFKEIIENKGLKKQHVAKQIGISNVVLSYYLNGKRVMPDEIKERLSLFLINI